jgi:hypothetical protein
MARWLPLLMATGCSFSSGLSGGDGGTGNEPAPDAPPDAPPDAFDERCFGGGTFYFCLDAVPTGTESLDNDSPLDTGSCTGSRQVVTSIPGTPPTSVCLVAADAITLDGAVTLSVRGTRPLVLLGVTSITLDGDIDASSFDTKLGPGANPSVCTTAGLDGTAGGTGGGGGAGGTFGSLGGAGGAGGGGANAGGMPPATPPATSTVLRGGCRGGVGASGGGGAGPVGNGGGAVYLVSRGTITVNGVIDASGGGGEGGLQARGGGGGGGSGGMIVFHAETLTVDTAARIFANGGAGGGGAGANADGIDGADPMPPNITQPAVGSKDTTAGRAPAGDGAAGTTAATAGTQGTNGGGGGGGGAGQIRVLRGGISFPGGTVSPTPTP